ncbi:MAG: Crp/Fnr family transcriptional regulator [FCB group bacterium]|nr:Crp/Fnr family transcriptional regulator [FCB group bacterium]
MHTYERLAGNDLFRGLDIFTVRCLLEEISYHRKTYRKNEIIIHEGDIISGQTILIRGSLRAEMVNHTGRVIKIEDIEGNQLLAPAFLFGNKNCSPVTLTANRESETIFFVKRSFLRLLQMNEIVLTNYLDIISGRAHYLSERIRFLAFQTIKGKIAHYLLELENKQSRQPLTLPHSQAQLADYFGVTRPSLTRVFRQLHKDGIILQCGKEIFITDRSRLKDILL